MLVFITEEEIAFWNIVSIHLVMKFKTNKLQFNSHNVDMHPHYLFIINSVSSDFWGKKIKVASDNQIRLRAKLNTKQFREGHIV